MTMSVPLPAEFFGKVGKKHNSQRVERGVWGEGSSQPGFDQASDRGQVHDAGEARVGNNKATSCEKWQKTTNAQQQQQEHQIVQQTNNNRQNNNNNNNSEGSVKIHYFPGRQQKMLRKSFADANKRSVCKRRICSREREGKRRENETETSACARLLRHNEAKSPLFVVRTQSTLNGD